jgi:hypothetical protein
LFFWSCFFAGFRFFFALASFNFLISGANFDDQMWHKFSGLRMKNETIFSNDDQISGYDSKKTVCSRFGHPGRASSTLEIKRGASALLTPFFPLGSA